MEDKQQTGFALLVSLVVVTAILSIGLVILDLSIKQVRLSSNSQDSEIAFHAANAGKECALYWRRQASAEMESGASTPSIDCFGESAGSVAPTPDAAVLDGSDGNAYVYEYDMTWENNTRCTEITNVVVVADQSSDGGDGVEVTNIRDLVPGFPTNNSFNCPAGARCTVAAVRGYNKACANIATFGTLEREILLKF